MSLSEDAMAAMVIDSMKRKPGFIAARREFGVLQHAARADIAMLDADGLSLMELKTERDSTRRLPDQARLYSYVANSCAVFVHPKHVKKTLAIVPEWWGVFVESPSESVPMGIERLCRPNPERKAIHIARLLHKGEAVRMLRDNGGVKGLSRAGAAGLHVELAARIPSVRDMEKMVCAVLARRPMQFGGFSETTGLCEWNEWLNPMLAAAREVRGTELPLFGGAA